MRLRDIPITAWVGITGILIAFICAIFAPWIAPFGETEVVGNVWQPADAQYFSVSTISAAISCRV